MNTLTAEARRVKTTIRFDSRQTASMINPAFGQAPVEPDWDQLAEDSMMQDAIERGLAGCSLMADDSIPAHVTRVIFAGYPTEQFPCVRYEGGWREEATGRPRMTAECADERWQEGRVIVLTEIMTDRQWWTAQTLGVATDGFMVEGEAKASRGSRKSRPVSSLDRMSWADPIEALIEETRPAGQAFDSPEWNEHIPRAERISRQPV